MKRPQRKPLVPRERGQKVKRAQARGAHTPPKIGLSEALLVSHSTIPRLVRKRMRMFAQRLPTTKELGRFRVSVASGSRIMPQAEKKKPDFVWDGISMKFLIDPKVGSQINEEGKIVKNGKYTCVGMVFFKMHERNIHYLVHVRAPRKRKEYMVPQMQFRNICYSAYFMRNGRLVKKKA